MGDRPAIQPLNPTQGQTGVPQMPTLILTITEPPRIIETIPAKSVTPSYQLKEIQ